MFIVVHYKLSIAEDASISEHIISRVPTELRYNVNAQTDLFFGSILRKDVIIPICVILEFQLRDRLNSQLENIDTLFGPPIQVAQYINGTEKKSWSWIEVWLSAK